MLPLPEPLYGLSIERITGQVVATQALDGENLASRELLRGGSNGIGEAVPGPIEQSHLWATGRTGIGLSMKASIERIFILRLAERAEWEVAHSGLVAVVGNILDNGEAWPTVGAVNEGIAIPSVSRIKEFVQAVTTGGCIRRDECLSLIASLAM